MKRILLFALCSVLLLCTACITINLTPGSATAPAETSLPNNAEAQAAQTAEPVAVATPEPNPKMQQPEVPAGTPILAPQPDEPTEEPTPYTPDLSLLPIEFDIPWFATEGRMLTVDLDFDGTEETYGYRIDETDNTATILIDDEPAYVLESWRVLDHVIFVDLDPATPYANLLVTIDWGSADYETTELHPENGKLVEGVVRQGIFLSEDGRLLEYLQTDLLGTKTGSREVMGEELLHVSDWLDCRVPTKRDWTTDRQECIDSGFLLHAVRDVEATVDGQTVYIPTGTYLYVVRFNEARTLVEVCTEDGMHALIPVEFLPEDYTYLLSGVPQDDLFDNILYAD